MSTKILDIYSSILSYSALHVDEDGRIYGRLTKSLKETYVEIEGESLVFPIQKQFNDPNQNKYYFHPLSENFLRGKSEVITVLEQWISTRLNFVTAVLAQSLLTLLGSPELHRRLNEEQASLLMAISDTDKKSAVEWSDLMRKVIKKSSTGGFVKLYLKHTGVINKESYARVGVITFPFYEELVNGEYDKNLRVKDRAAFQKLMEFIFPGINKPMSYSFGTRTQVSPYLHALMGSSSLVASRLNDINSIYSDYINDSDELRFDMDWFSHFEDMDALRKDIKSIPELKGNSGVTPVSERNHPAQDMVNKAPVPEPVPEKKTNDITYAQNMQPVNQPYPQPINNPPVPQQQYNNQQPVQAQPQQPQVRVNERGAINFSDVMRGNPSLAMQNAHAVNNLLPAPPMMLMPNGQVVPMNMQPQVPMQTPSWAMPVQPPGYPQQMVVQQPMMAPMAPMMPNLPALPPGYQYVQDQRTGQWVAVQVPMQPQPMMNQAPPPPGWGYRPG